MTSFRRHARFLLVGPSYPCSQNVQSLVAQDLLQKELFYKHELDQGLWAAHGWRYILEGALGASGPHTERTAAVVAAAAAGARTDHRQVSSAPCLDSRSIHDASSFCPL